MPQPADPSPSRSGPPSRWKAQVQLSAVAFAVLLVGISAQWGTELGGAGVAALLSELTTSAALAGAWLLMALGFGVVLRPLLVPVTRSPLAIEAGIGVASALAIVSLVGTVGWPGDRIGAIAIVVLGGTIGVARCIQLGLGRNPEHGERLANTGVTGPWLGVLFAIPAMAALIVASAAAPGWLWTTEFGGYDALSYHLQLPREWLEFGRIVPLEHCVYAAMPNAMESAFLHLMLVRGDALLAGVACQFLHAGLAVLTALLCGSAARTWALRFDADERTASRAATIATLLVLATPWTIVVGSLAYSEMAVTVAFATGVLVLGDRGIEPHRAAIVAGLCAAVAIAAKLSAVGFVAVPLILLALLVVPPRRWIAAGLCGAVVAMLTLAPWLMRNWLGCGSPTFPFLPALFGEAWWTTQQFDVWRSAHHGDGPELKRLWTQWLGFGFGAAPEPGEPWRTQWAITPWLGVAAIVMLALRRPRVLLPAAAATIVLPLLFWLFFTHMQSRFLVPLIVPLAIVVALAIAPSDGRAARSLRPLFLLLLGAWPLLLFATERGGAPAASLGATSFLTGDAFASQWREARRSASTRRAMLDGASPAFWINHALPADSHVLLVGVATPWYLGQGTAETPATFVWNTVWDRGPLSSIIGEHPDDPDAWRSALRERGFTHAIIDLGMLERWRIAGWLDPSHSAEAINLLIGDPRRVLAASETGVVMIDLSPPT